MFRRLLRSLLRRTPLRDPRLVITQGGIVVTEAYLADLPRLTYDGMPGCIIKWGTGVDAVGVFVVE